MEYALSLLGVICFRCLNVYFSREYVPKLENLFVKQSPNENEKSVDSLSDLLPGIFLLI